MQINFGTYTVVGSHIYKDEKVREPKYRPPIPIYNSNNNMYGGFDRFVYRGPFDMFMPPRSGMYPFYPFDRMYPYNRMYPYGPRYYPNSFDWNNRFPPRPF